MWKVYVLEFVIALVIAILWANGIDNMSRNHPDYDGKDFLDF